MMLACEHGHVDVVRSLLAADAAPPPACAQPLPVLPDRIVVH